MENKNQYQAELFSNRLTKKYKSLKEIRIDVFESHYKKREKNCARLIKYFSKYPDMFEQFDQEELKTLKAYCYISYQGSFVYRCQKIKEYRDKKWRENG